MALLLFAGIEDVRAQSITLHGGDLDKLLKENSLSTENLWIVNGNRLFYQAAEETDEVIPLGRVSGLLWNIAAMRLIDKGAFKPDEPVRWLMNDFEIDSPFRKTITLRHLLAGTAGFATPPWYASTLPYKTNRTSMKKDNDWRDHLTPISTPGSVGRDDIVGQALLAKAISSYWEQSYHKTLYDLVFAPLGIEESEMLIPTGEATSYDDFYAPVLDIRLSYSAFVKLMTILSVNRLDGEEDFLSRVNYEALMKGEGWKIHPLAPGRSYGLASSSIEGRRIARIYPTLWYSDLLATSSLSIISFPDAGIIMAVAYEGTHFFEHVKKLEDIATFIAREFIPETSWYKEDAVSGDNKEARNREGYFMLDDSATAWLGEKLRRAKRFSPYVTVSSDKVTFLQYGEIETYIRVAPRAYESKRGIKLYVSDFAGGYITVDDELYRYTGAMGNPNLLISPFLICIFILLTASIYWRSKRGKDWRRFAAWSITGTILFSVGFYSEIILYPTLWVEEQSLWAILLWRAAFNIGLMLLLTAPMYAWRFGKQNDFHENVKQIMVGSHVIVISAAALVLALLSVAWGLAGELMP